MAQPEKNEKPLLDLDLTNKGPEQKGENFKEVGNRHSERKYPSKRKVTSELSAQVLPPVTKRKLATYQVINAYRKDPLLIGNPTGDDILPFDVIIPGTYMFYDPFEEDLAKKQKMIRNVTRPGIEIIDGKQVQTEVVEDIIMSKGFLEVNMETNYPLYVLMELHPLNGSNKRRPKNGSVPVFERTDLKYKSTASQDAQLDLSDQASKEVLALPFEQVVALAATLKLPTSGIQPGEIRLALRIFARENPIPYFKLNPDSSQMVKINFLDALELGFVDYDQNVKGYYFSTESKPFFTHTVDEEPVSATVKHLNSPKGRKDYERIQNYLGFWSDSED